MRACRSQTAIRTMFIQMLKHGLRFHPTYCGSPSRIFALCSLQTKGGHQKKHHSSHLAILCNPSDFITNTCAHRHRDDSNTDSSMQNYMNEQHFRDQLNYLPSSKQIFKLVCSLEELSDTMAAAALQRVRQIELQGGELKDPKAVMQDKAFKTLCFQFEHNSTRISTPGLVEALHALVQLRVDPWSTLMVRLVSESQDRLDKGNMTIRSLCVLGESMLELEGPGCVMFQQIIEQVQRIKLQYWEPEEVVMGYSMLQAGVGVKDQCQTLLNQMNNHTISISSQLKPNQVSTVLHALVVLNQAHAIPLVINLCKHSVRHVANFTHEELVKVLGAFVHFGHSDRYFTEALERRVSKTSFTMDPEAVSRVMQYCSRRQILSKPIFDAVAESFVYNSDNFTTRQIAWQIMPFGKLNYLPPNAASLFRKLEVILSSRFSQFQPRTLLNLLHSCTLVERFPVNFVAKIFNTYFLQQLQCKKFWCLFSVRLSL